MDVNEIGKTVDRIKESYHELGGINLIDGSNLPSEQRIEDIVGLLREIMFPGYVNHSQPKINDLDSFLAEHLINVHKLLKPELEKVLPKDESKSIEERAEDLIMSLFNELPHIRRVLKTDVEAAYNGDPAAKSYDEIILSYPFIKAITVYRVAHYLQKQEVPLLPRMMSEYAHRITQIDIHPGAEIGEYFFIDHGTGVVIGETAVIGRNVRIYQGVTLGALSIPDAEALRGVKRHPTIEDDVTVYANATILGDITIGHDSVIGGNLMLINSVDPEMKVYRTKDELKIKPKCK